LKRGNEMDSIVDLIKFFFFVGIVVLFVSGIIGYGCKACNRVTPKDFEEAPCMPVMPNGEKNPHYSNTWRACQAGCGMKQPFVDLKTCECTCK
jgi:hypothetical protein